MSRTGRIIELMRDRTERPHQRATDPLVIEITTRMKDLRALMDTPPPAEKVALQTLMDGVSGEARVLRLLAKQARARAAREGVFLPPRMLAECETLCHGAGAHRQLLQMDLGKIAAEERAARGDDDRRRKEYIDGLKSQLDEAIGQRDQAADALVSLQNSVGRPAIPVSERGRDDLARAFIDEAREMLAEATFGRILARARERMMKRPIDKDAS